MNLNFFDWPIGTMTTTGLILAVFVTGLVIRQLIQRIRRPAVRRTREERKLAKQLAQGIREGKFPTALLAFCAPARKGAGGCQNCKGSSAKPHWTVRDASHALAHGLEENILDHALCKNCLGELMVISKATIKPKKEKAEKVDKKDEKKKETAFGILGGSLAKIVVILILLGAYSRIFNKGITIETILVGLGLFIAVAIAFKILGKLF